MSKRERVERAVYAAVDELNKQLPKGVRVEKEPSAPLYGKGGVLESLDFVTFVMEVETKMQQEFGGDIMLTDDSLLSKESSPFTTLGTLVEYLAELITDGRLMGAA